MTKVDVIMESLVRMRVGEPLMLTQLFEAVHAAKDTSKVKIPPQYIDFFAEKEFIAWDSSDTTAKVDPTVVAVILAIEWKQGDVPSLWQVPTITK